MSELIVACTRNGESIPFDCVKTLRNAVARHLTRPHTVVCLTDQPERCTGVAFVDISAMRLTEKWAKMALFEPQWRDRSKVVYLDFDTKIIGDLAPLADVPGEFAVCQSRTKLCHYHPSVMVIGGGMGGFVWNSFEHRKLELLSCHQRFGPATCIEALYPSAPSLQRFLPQEFFTKNLQLTLHLSI